MKFTPTSTPDVILIEAEVFGDRRGFFMETYQAERFAEAGIPTNFVQEPFWLTAGDFAGAALPDQTGARQTGAGDRR